MGGGGETEQVSSKASSDHSQAAVCRRSREESIDTWERNWSRHCHSAASQIGEEVRFSTDRIQSWRRGKGMAGGGERIVGRGWVLRVVL